MYFICLAVRGVPELSDRPVVYTRPGAVETKAETTNDPIRALYSQVGSKYANTAAKVAQVDTLEGHDGIKEEWTPPMSIYYQSTLLTIARSCSSSFHYLSSSFSA